MFEKLFWQRLDERTGGGAAKHAKRAWSGKVGGNPGCFPTARAALGLARLAPARLRARAWCFGVAAACLLAAPLAQAGAIDKLHAFLETTRTLRAEFAQQVVAKNGKKPQLSSGVMLISRPGKFRWQIDKPYSQLLVGDGEKVWIYDADLRQVTVKKFDAALGSTPAALLVGGNVLDKNFTLREAGEHDGVDWLEAVPKTADSGFERLRLGFAGSELRAMELYDNFGQTTTLLFAHLERNVPIAAALLHFTPPAGVDVIGE